VKFISLFAGIGGLDLGFERAGMNCVAQVEIDDYCQKILTKHWPNVPKYKDVRDVGKHNLPAADLICGGFPCQPHSLAGKRKGAADDRNLWPEYLRIIDELRPDWVLGENVPGIITTILDQVLSDLEHLEYTCQPFIIPACGFNAPHKRDRVFIVAHTNTSKQRPQSSERQHNQGRNDANSVQGWQEISSGFGAGFEKRIATNSISQPCGTQQPESIGRREAGITGTDNETISDTSRAGLSEREAHQGTTVRPVERTNMGSGRETWNYWQSEPGVCGMANGIPNRVDRLKSLGNAVVPQVAEFIGRGIMQVETVPNTTYTGQVARAATFR
jgi:DNA (cytosine-5)-methyltransferase 1